jgi:hypothetical protein
MKYVKILTWYFMGFILMLLIVSIIPARVQDIIKIMMGFLAMSMGLLIGIFSHDIVCKKPYLLLFLPLLYIFTVIVVSNL